MGTNSFQFTTSNVFAATTNTDTANQILISIDDDNIGAIDFVILATEGAIRNYVKISVVVHNNVVNYVEYNNLPLNGYIGDYAVVYNIGTDKVDLTVSPNSANLTTHRMSITKYLA